MKGVVSAEADWSLHLSALHLLSWLLLIGSTSRQRLPLWLTRLCSRDEFLRATPEEALKTLLNWFEVFEAAC